MVKKAWIVREQHRELAQELARGLQITPVIAQVLINRGITTVEAGRRFFQCDLADTPDPFLMLGMDLAVHRIKEALSRGENIVVYGDYDADGQTATALLVRALRDLTEDPSTISYYLPDRFDEGYGLNSEAVTALSRDASLLISVDCGIASPAEVELARELGLDVIVTDHHEPGPVLPPAAAVLNPKQPGCSYPFKGLAGVGVALKLVQGLGLPREKWQTYMDLVALGTVADLVPLQGENRVLVSLGLKQMVNTENLGIRALLEVSQVTEPSASDLGFRLGPRLNAGGRVGDSTRGVRLLLTEVEEEARALAAELDAENAKRQQLEAAVLQEAVAVVERYNLAERPALVVWGENWHQGVVGIVASRLVEKYYRPTIVVSLADGQGTASARSIAGLDLYQTLTGCADLLSRFGGHAMAAGLSLPEENLLAFQRRFEKLCAAVLSPEDYTPKLYIDGITTLDQISHQFIQELARLEPHGLGNPGPVFKADVAVLRTRAVGADNRHLQLTVHDATAQEMAAIAFGAGSDQAELERAAESISLAFVPQINGWRGVETVQLQVKDWQQGAARDSFVRCWMVEKYPWKLGPSYYQSAALTEEGQEVRHSPVYQVVDERGVWDQAALLKTRCSPQEPVLILVNRPVSVLEVCRELRIKIPGGAEFIGFEHQHLKDLERKELEQGSFSWIVSTGVSYTQRRWPTVWLWEPPLTWEIHRIWSSLVEDGGELVAAYGPEEVRQLQGHLKRDYPDRPALVRIYSLLRSAEGRIGLAEAVVKLEEVGLAGALPVATGVFVELGLWERKEDAIIYLPPPPEKLDLEQAVLYNKVTKIRKQSAQYLKRCLERGFFQDGLEREN